MKRKAINSTNDINRRDFVQRAAMTAAVFAVTPPLSPLPGSTVVVIREPYSDLRLEIKATNRLDRPVNLMVPGGCPVILQVLNGAPPSGRVLWDSRYARSSMGCALSLVQARINPDESKTFVRGVERAEILGDSLPPARYFIRGLLDIEPTAVVVDAGEITISK